MIYRTLLYIIIMVTASCTTNKAYLPKDCDLIFQVAEMTEFSKAITDATAQKDIIKYDHVGIIILENKIPHVLEANSKTGVSLVTLQDFINKSAAGYVIKRVKLPIATQEIIRLAKSHLGEAYDWSFLPNNGKMYCSELIYDCFLSNEGKHLFHASPMNFRDEAGNMPQFWIDLFQKLGEKIPEGILGTNPNDISKETILTEIYRFLPINGLQK